MLLLVAALLAQTPDAPVPATLPATTAEAAAVAAPEAVTPPPTLTTPTGCADAVVDVEAAAMARTARTHAVLRAFAEQGRRERLATAVGSGALAAGLIGTSITYVAVSKVDTQLSKIDADDTTLAGVVIGAIAVIPTAIFAESLIFPSNEEARLAGFEGDAGPGAERVRRVRDDVAAEAAAPSWPGLVGGGALVVGGLAAGGLGAYFLLLPHLENPRGPVTHGTGAELIGGGVAALGTGVAVLLTTSTAPAQLALFE